MNKNGGYTWLQTCATVICNSKNAEEQNVICVNYVISAREYEHLILDCCQLEGGLEPIKREESGGDSGAGSPGSDPSNDNGHNRQGDSNSKPPKSETPEPRRRVRSDNTSNTNTNSAPSNSNTLSNDVVNVDETTTQPVAVVAPAITVSKRGAKRKIKHLDISEEVSPVVLTSQNVDVSPQNSILNDRHPSIAAIEEHTESSVKDLENAMSKHLPSPVNSSANTDFSTDALLKQHQDKGSTIQWIGHPNHHFHQQTSPMPATALLRQLYANRESVIRATRPSTGGVFYPGENCNLFYDKHYKSKSQSVRNQGVRICI